MKVLILCEESQVVAKEFRKLAHEAYSCDLEKCSGGHPEWHIQKDAFVALDLMSWDIVIMHPPCTHTALCGNRWYWKSPLRAAGIKFCKDLWEKACKVCECVVLEQPKTIMQSFIGPKTQVVHPYQYGHGETKETWLWIKGLKDLVPTDEVEGRENRIWKMPPSKNRSKLRSKTYPGIGKAMAEQWGGIAE